MSLKLYLLGRRIVPLIAKRSLMARMQRGKEHPTRWTEKLGAPTLPRPDGTLIWLHAVGLGEVLSLRGLIHALHQSDQTLNFLVTTSSLAAAKAFEKQDLPNTRHQFLPLDTNRYTTTFLDHWDPQLVVWAEQDIWPGFIDDVAWRDIPQVLVNARMNAASFAKHQKFAGAFRASLNKMARITAQDQQSADHLTRLGASQSISVTGGTKAGAPQLSHDPDFLADLKAKTTGRRVWLCASAYLEDVAVAVEAQAILRQSDPDALLIIAPRDPKLPLDATIPRHSNGDVPDGPLWICDTLGDLGTLYQLADLALIGGTFNVIQGHNPWEAVALGCGVLHGPNTANFRADFASLDACNAAVMVQDSAAIAAILRDTDARPVAANAAPLINAAKDQITDLARELRALL